MKLNVAINFLAGLRTIAILPAGCNTTPALSERLRVARKTTSTSDREALINSRCSAAATLVTAHRADMSGFITPATTLDITASLEHHNVAPMDVLLNPVPATNFQLGR
jgi:hypothetical protein